MGEVEKTWDQRILEQVDVGIDTTLLEENLKLTPTQRLEKMLKLVEQLELLKKDLKK